MKVVLFGASGMVGQGALREAILADDVDEILLVGRSPSGVSHPKVRDLVHGDFLDFSSVASQLRGFDLGVFAIGISSTGTDEATYTKVTHDYAVAAATVLAQENANMTFVLVTAQGTDPTEKGNVMWARVKGRAENAVRAMPFRKVYCFRPAVIQPRHGATSRTTAYRIFYALGAPFVALARLVAPNALTTTEHIGRAMLALARGADAPSVLGTADFNRLGA